MTTMQCIDAKFGRWISTVRILFRHFEFFTNKESVRTSQQWCMRLPVNEKRMAKQRKWSLWVNWRVCLKQWCAWRNDEHLWHQVTKLDLSMYAFYSFVAFSTNGQKGHGQSATSWKMQIFTFHEGLFPNITQCSQCHKRWENPRSTHYD